MTTITLDFTGMQDEKLLRPGIYSAQVMDMYEGMTRKGNQKVTIVFSLLDEEYLGRKVYGDFPLMDNAMSYLRKAMLALGFPMDRMRGKTLTITADDVRGRQCRLVIEHSFGPQGEQNRVSRVLPPKLELNDGDTLSELSNLDF